jgi:hypothetical protein
MPEIVMGEFGSVKLVDCIGFENGQGGLGGWLRGI